MKILITAKYISGSAHEGGSSRFFHTVGKTLAAIGHEVVLSNQPADVVKESFDLIICSHHEILKQIKENPAPKVCISHGIVGDEHFDYGADRYISVSEEVRKDNLMRGIDSEVIGQPVEMMSLEAPHGEKLRKILVIRKSAIVTEDSFSFLSEKYDVRVSDIGKPIEDQISWADLCITVGRGAIESMAQGKPVIIADVRQYNLELTGAAALGDGYATPELIGEIARNNFSGRRFKIPVTREWIESEIEKYDPNHAEFLYNYVKENHDAAKIVAKYLEPIKQKQDFKFGWGVLINNIQRFNMVFQQSAIAGDIEFVKNPKSATPALNMLLDRIEATGANIAILSHQDMYYRSGWIDQVKDQLSKLPDDWIVAGIIGKDSDGRICGVFRDMRIPQHFNTTHIHNFPHPVCCFDECCIIVNLKSGFRFDERMEGFDLYGTLCVLQAWEVGGSAWVINAPTEHYCMRPFTWEPDDLFKKNYKMLWDRFSKLYRVDSTAIGASEDIDERDQSLRAFMTSAE